MKRRKALSRIHPDSSSCRLEGLAHIDNRCCKVMYTCFPLWVILTSLLLLAQIYAPFKSSFTYLYTSERVAAAASGLIGVCLAIFDTILRRVIGSLDLEIRGRLQHKTGLRKLCDSVQLMAIATDFIMATFRVPVVVDRFLGTRVHLVRWLEWTIAGYMMTYMIEIIDVETNEKANYLAMTQALSTACALLFPFLPNIYCYVILMAVSFALYIVLFPRLWTKYCRAAAAKAKMTDLRHMAKTSIVGVIASIQEKDDAQRAMLASSLLAICVIVWSVFVLIFFIEPISRVFFKQQRESPTWPFVCNSILHAVVKLFFSGFIVAAEESLFGLECRITRLNTAIREFLGSSMLSATGCAALVHESNGRVITAFSSPFLHMLNIDTSSQEQCHGGSWDDNFRMMSLIINSWGSNSNDLATNLRLTADAIMEAGADDFAKSRLPVPLCCEYQYSETRLRLCQTSPRALSDNLKSKNVHVLIEKCLAANKLSGPERPVVLPWHASSTASASVVVVAISLDSESTLLVLQGTSDSYTKSYIMPVPVSVERDNLECPPLK